MSVIRSVLLSLVLAGTAGAAATPTPIVLRLKVDEVGKDYELETRTVQERKFPDGTTKQDEVASRMVIHRKVAAVEGALEVRTVTKEILVAVKDFVSQVDPKPDVRTARISDRGEPRVEGTPASPDEHLWPTFPEGEVKEGHLWETQVPASEEFPVPFKLNHKLVRFEDVGGKVHAVVQTWGAIRGEDPKLGTKFSGGVDGTLTLAVDTGLIAESKTEITLHLQYAKPTRHGHQSVRKTVSRTMKPRP